MGLMTIFRFEIHIHKLCKNTYREPIYGSDRVVIEEHYYEDDA